MDKKWYVTQIQPRQGKKAEEYVERQGFEVYLARLKVKASSW